MDKSGAGPSKGNYANETPPLPRNGANGGQKSIRSVFLRAIVTVAAIAYIIYSYRETISSRLGSLFVDGSCKQIEDRIQKQPNIVFILTDDQDVQLDSLHWMPVVKERIIKEGINFTNHFGTTALCCPGRATLFRGQHAHNTNITHVGGNGGGYSKWRRTGEWQAYLPLWLQQAGYTTSYTGKFLNGYGLHNYKQVPEGWDWADLLVGPYVYKFQHVVTSINGGHPYYYEGWHQVDVLRLKALNRLFELTRQDKPFYLEIAPVTPHVQGGGKPTIPPERHNDAFPDLKAPRTPNWNPSDHYTQQKVAWLKDMPLMNDTIVDLADLAYRKRAEALLGVDDLVSDVIDFLEEKGILDETYIIYSSDNGFHIGNHRLPGGKGQAYREDVNLPFAVRGPGIQAGVVSKIPQSHVDIAPTLLDIAGLPKSYWPPFFDGRSLLQEWKTLSPPKDNISREVINVEFWGSTVVPAYPYTRHIGQNSYKSLRIVSESENYLFNRWCYDNATELYNTTADPYELVNLAINPSEETQQLINRLSGLLLVTKSCGQDNCTSPWNVLAKHYNHINNRNATSPPTPFSSLSEAQKPEFDAFFESLPHFGFHRCAPFQRVENEGPYFPPSSIDLGRVHRGWSPPEGDGEEDGVVWENNGTMLPASEEVAASSKGIGTWKQRHATFEDLLRDARPLTQEEIGWPVVRCGEDNEWCGAIWDDD